MRSRIVLAIGVVILATLEGSAQTGLRIQDVMTVTELRETGVSRLTSTERAALDTWLNRYTAVAVSLGLSQTSGSQVSAPPISSLYSAVGRGHWVQEVSSNGKYVTLEDDSLWEISSIDQIDTALWLPITDITVRHVNGVGSFLYELVNTEDGEKAAAKYLSGK